MSNALQEQAMLLRQRSSGELRLHMTARGVDVLRESGCSKLRLPRGSSDAIMINTSGGLAGGDVISIDARCAEGASLRLASQAAERVYRSVGPPATLTVNLEALAGSTLCWMPRETLLFEGAALQRRIDVSLHGNARFLAVEAIVLGRAEMGETIQNVSLRDDWRIHRNGALIHADSLRFSGLPPQSAATLSGARAFATVLLVAENAEQHLDAVRGALGTAGAASFWNGKLLARLACRDGFALGKALFSVLSTLEGPAGLPKTWSL